MSAIVSQRPLGFPWQTEDPFLFCVHHDDAYPAGDERMAPPTAALDGRDIGQDFEGKDGWRMYHGTVVPGFPGHPHRGFETVTIVRRGFIDHSDSLGAAARFGQGDVQWLTAGAGIVHAEMFPLIEQNAPNPLELFQIWLNLPAKNKLVEPHFAMLWGHKIPRRDFTDAEGRVTTVTIIAGAHGGATPPSPPPASWATEPGADVAIWTIGMASGARWTLPPAAAGVNRNLYVFRGDGLVIDGTPVARGVGVKLRPEESVALANGDAPTELLLLQGRPIGEPVVQYGPFVMNTRAEIQKAFFDYQSTRFGGWPWPADDPVHPRDAGRFARHADGRLESADESSG